MSYVRFMSLFALLFLVLTGCDSAVGVDDEPEVEEETVDAITVRLEYFRAIRDCDVGPGDFEFEAIVESDGFQEQFSGSAELNDGERFNINKTYEIEAERRNGNEIEVTLAVRERDDPVIGPPNYNDLNRRSTMTHTYGPSGWSNLSNNPIKIGVQKAASCQVELSYTIDVN